MCIRDSGKMAPNKPIRIPSNMNGTLMYQLVAPTFRMMAISALRAYIVILIELLIRKSAKRVNKMTKINPPKRMESTMDTIFGTLDVYKRQCMGISKEVIER